MKRGAAREAFVRIRSRYILDLADVTISRCLSILKINVSSCILLMYYSSITHEKKIDTTSCVSERRLLKKKTLSERISKSMSAADMITRPLIHPTIRKKDVVVEIANVISFHAHDKMRILITSIPNEETSDSRYVKYALEHLRKSDKFHERSFVVRSGRGSTRTVVRTRTDPTGEVYSRHELQNYVAVSLDEKCTSDRHIDTRIGCT